jgi:hypothetical protein
VIRGEIKRPSWSRIEVCKFIIDHELGRPRVKLEPVGSDGTPLTWAALVLMAEQAEEEGEKEVIASLILHNGLSFA